MSLDCIAFKLEIVLKSKPCSCLCVYVCVSVGVCACMHVCVCAGDSCSYKNGVSCLCGLHIYLLAVPWVLLWWWVWQIKCLCSTGQYDICLVCVCLLCLLCNSLCAFIMFIMYFFSVDTKVVAVHSYYTRVNIGFVLSLYIPPSFLHICYVRSLLVCFPLSHVRGQAKCLKNWGCSPDH